MWLTDLAAIARSTGCPVVEVSGWKTRGHGPMTDVRTIICHHTAGPKSGNYPSLSTVENGRPGLDGPLAQLGLARDGTVYVIAAGLCWHAGVSRDPSYTNSHAIGIEAEGTGSDPWPDVQMDAYARLCRALADHYRVPCSRVLGHKETCAPVGRKPDPNFDMDAFRARIAALNGDDMPTTDEIAHDVLAYPYKGRQVLSYIVTADTNARNAARDSAQALAIVKALAAKPTGLSADEITAAAKAGAAQALSEEIDSATVQLNVTGGQS